MNKEIKAELDRELETLILRIIESDDAVRVVGLDDITEWVDQKLQQQYLQGAKDVREVMKLELIGAKECTTIFNVGDTLKDLCEVTYNKAILDINSKAQQFLDSLEK